MKKREVRKTVSDHLDRPREYEIQSRTVTFTLRTLIIVILLAITAGYFFGVYWNIAAGHNPSVGDLGTICMVDPQYEGMQCMQVTKVQGNSDDGLVTALFTGHWDTSFFSLRAQIQ